MLKHKFTASLILLFLLSVPAMSFSAESEYGDDMAVVLFGITALTIYTANKFIPQLKNLFTELLSLSTVVFSAITVMLIPEVPSGNNSAAHACARA